MLRFDFICCALVLTLTNSVLAGSHGQMEPAESARQEVEAALKLTPMSTMAVEYLWFCTVCHLPEGGADLTDVIHKSPGNWLGVTSKTVS